MRAITLPLRERLARTGDRFGVGLYLPAKIARTLACPEGRNDLERLARFIALNALDPFTYNAFPFGDFQRDGLKADVFRPTWMDPERLQFTLDVAHVATRVAQVAGGLAQPAHLSISTHPGGFGAWITDEADRIAIASNLARAVTGLAKIESDSGLRIVLALEAEPRASSGDSASLAAFLGRLREWGARVLARAAGLRRRRDRVARAPPRHVSRRVSFGGRIRRARTRARARGEPRSDRQAPILERARVARSGARRARPLALYRARRAALPASSHRRRTCRSHASRRHARAPRDPRIEPGRARAVGELPRMALSLPRAGRPRTRRRERRALDDARARRSTSRARARRSGAVEDRRAPRRDRDVHVGRLARDAVSSAGANASGARNEPIGLRSSTVWSASTGT